MPLKPTYAKQPLTIASKTMMLDHMVYNAQRLNQLQTCLNKYLQPAAAQHCYAASFNNGTLTILTTQSHWATRLRYQQKRLIQQLQDHIEFVGLERIMIKVSPDMPSATSSDESYLTLSDDAAETIRETACYIKHPNLKAALERLASHNKKLSRYDG